VTIAEQVEHALQKADGLPLNTSQATAFNYLIDYQENPEWFASHEGQRLVGLCIEVLKDM
jgi:hypothetical protein